MLLCNVAARPSLIAARQIHSFAALAALSKKKAPVATGA
jgi:hypothetical protein